MKRFAKFSLMLSMGLLAGNFSMAQKDASGSLEKIEIMTSAQCGMCKDRIEKALAYEKGVKKATLDVESKVVSVEYKPAKTSPEKIRAAIAGTGYDADDVAADPNAYDNLPGCCKKGGMEKH